MKLTGEERARIADSKHKIQSAANSLTHVDPRKVPHFDEIEECLENADESLKGALRTESEPEKPNAIPTENRCKERASLSRDLAVAIKNVYLSKKAYYDARFKKQDTSDLWAALQTARVAELTVERAFNDHVNRHGCKI